MRKKVSEKTMADAFEKYLSIGDSSFQCFSYYAREVQCEQGIPDFIGLRNLRPSSAEGLELVAIPRHLKTVSLSVLSLLQYNAPRTSGYIFSRIGHSLSQTVQAIDYLQCMGLILSENSGHSFVLNSSKLPKFNLTAFELKTSDWRRALFQSSQYKAFASQVYAVFPPQLGKTIDINVEKFRKRNIGIMLFDTDELKAELIFRPMLKRPVSKRHYYYALTQLAAETAS